MEGCIDAMTHPMLDLRNRIKKCNGSPQQKWLYNTTDSTIRNKASGGHTTSLQVMFIIIIIGLPLMNGRIGLCIDCGSRLPPINPCDQSPSKDLPFCDLTKTFEQRVADLVKQLTPKEKIGLVSLHLVTSQFA
jgi:hypothetical protein